jgi:hypothetical protein
VYSYAAFGARLECTFELPELFPGTGGGPAATRWEIRALHTEPPICIGNALGLDSVYGTVQVRSFASSDVLRLVFDDTGTFDVRSGERVIAWYPGPNADTAAVRADLLGRVMALAAHADGAIALHASAVAIDDRAIAFLGPKHAGKSTLAMALVRRGARLLTDDTLIVRFEGQNRAWAAPGVQRVRLWDDSARALGAESQSAVGAKPVVDQLPAECLQFADVPLAACYVLRTVEAEDAPAVQCQPLSSIRAALACVSFSKLGALAGGAESAVILDRAATLARAVTVYTADVRRDLARLDEIAETFLAWHRSSGASAEAAP